MSNLIRGISENGGVVFCGVDSTEIVRTAEQLHHTSATCSAAPLMRARSSGSNSATVPYSWANTPPRSMSPASRTGASTSRARPMLTISSAFRLISAGLPAPSMTMMSTVSARLL